eukprot:PhM_4_TR7837/c0_g1_i1/m.13950
MCRQRRGSAAVAGTRAARLAHASGRGGARLCWRCAARVEEDGGVRRKVDGAVRHVHRLVLHPVLVVVVVASVAPRRDGVDKGRHAAVAIRRGVLQLVDEGQQLVRRRRHALALEHRADRVQDRVVQTLHRAVGALVLRQRLSELHVDGHLRVDLLPQLVALLLEGDRPVALHLGQPLLAAAPRLLQLAVPLHPGALGLRVQLEHAGLVARHPVAVRPGVLSLELRLPLVEASRPRVRHLFQHLVEVHLPPCLFLHQEDTLCLELVDASAAVRLDLLQVVRSVHDITAQLCDLRLQRSLLLEALLGGFVVLEYGTRRHGLDFVRLLLLYLLRLRLDDCAEVPVARIPREDGETLLDLLLSGLRTQVLFR